MQLDDNKSGDRMNPVLSFNCEGDVRTKKDLHQQSHAIPSLTDHLPMHPSVFPGGNIGKSQSNNSETYVNDLSSYQHMDHHGLNIKNHNAGNSLNYQSPYPAPPTAPQPFVHANSINSVNSPNHLAIPNSDYSGTVDSGARNLASSHAQGSLNDNSNKVNYSGAIIINESDPMPVVKLEKMANRNLPTSNDFSKSGVKVSVSKKLYKDPRMIY